jgi:hypothetical protein
MRLKRTIVSRDVPHYKLNTSIVTTHRMRAGDLGVFEVLEIGKHEYAQMADGKNRGIFPGDQLVAAFADRYATSQYEGYVPEGPQEVYHILGAGGVIGIVRSKNYSLKDIEPTTVRLVGYCCDDKGTVINTKFHVQERKSFRGEVGPKVILSIGSTMDSGKTTTAAFVSRGLAIAGHKVAFIKLTGTCYTRDREFVYDCGADAVADFSDVGYPSTFMCEKSEILDIYQSLIDRLAPGGFEYVVMEIADGLMQRETMFLLRDQAFMRTIHKVVFSCGDSLSAFHGVQLLKEWGIEVAAISGRFTMSPLLVNEVHDHIKVPVFTIDEVMTGMHNHLFGARVANGTVRTFEHVEHDGN